jgi:hypothetical protein
LIRHAYFFAAPARIGEAIGIGYVSGTKDPSRPREFSDSSPAMPAAMKWLVNWEAIIFSAKGRRPFGPSARPLAVYRYDWFAKRDPVHPMVKPIALSDELPLARRI